MSKSRNKQHIQSIMERILNHFYKREEQIIGKQRVAVFIYSSLILLIGIFLNICEVTGPQLLFFKVANSIHGILTVVTFLLYYYRRVSLVSAISLFCVVAQVEISVENIHCALLATPYDIALIIGNMVLSAIILLLSVIAYIRIVPYVVASLAISTFGICIYLTGSEVLSNFFFIFLLAFFVLSLLSRTLTAKVSKLEKENNTLKGEQQDVLDVFRLNKQQMQSYMTLARHKKLEPEKTAELLTIVGGETERHIRENVGYYLKQSAIEFDKMKERLPELTASELEICSLILKEKKIKEIIEELGKSHSNITCQRTNVRAKLGLKKEDNLFQALRERMGNPK